MLQMGFTSILTGTHLTGHSGTEQWGSAGSLCQFSRDCTAAYRWLLRSRGASEKQDQSTGNTHEGSEKQVLVCKMLSRNFIWERFLSFFFSTGSMDKISHPMLHILG